MVTMHKYDLYGEIDALAIMQAQAATLKEQIEDRREKLLAFMLEERMDTAGPTTMGRRADVITSETERVSVAEARKRLTAAQLADISVTSRSTFVKVR